VHIKISMIAVDSYDTKKDSLQCVRKRYCMAMEVVKMETPSSEGNPFFGFVSSDSSWLISRPVLKGLRETKSLGLSFFLLVTFLGRPDLFSKRSRRFLFIFILARLCMEVFLQVKCPKISSLHFYC
jgi:hypothetical protein